MSTPDHHEAAPEPTDLDEGSCRALLRAGSFGRLGFVDDEGVMILPVNYALVDQQILIRTSAGSKLHAARSRDAAALEIDAADAERGSGWSVVARGALEEVTDPDELERIAERVQPLAGGDRPYVLRLLPDSVSGRQIPLRRGARQEQTWIDQDATDLLG